jgi:hypothetical protein
MQDNRLPVVPKSVLKRHKVDEVTDSRFKASARLLQSLWREDHEFKVGSYRTSKGRRRKLGSRLHIDCAKQGANFLHPDIAKLALRESVYREPGALIDEERLWSNLLSSQPLCFNLFGSLKLNAPMGNQFFQRLFPDFVQNVIGIYFEHSPGRHNPAFTDDHTAFDIFVTCTTTSGEKGFLAIEVKYSESMNEPAASLRPRYDQLSADCAVFKDPAASALRENPLQQLWREHMLCQSLIANGLYNHGRFIVIYPEQNNNCDAAINAYRTHLIDGAPSATGFEAITLESCLANLRGIDNVELAEKLFRRYLDFGRVEKAIFS